MVLSMRAEYESLLREILSTGSQDGSLNVIDAAVQSRAILAMLTGITTWYNPDGPLKKEELVEVYVDTLTRGILST